MDADNLTGQAVAQTSNPAATENGALALASWPWPAGRAGHRAARATARDRNRPIQDLTQILRRAAHQHRRGSDHRAAPRPRANQRDRMRVVPHQPKDIDRPEIPVQGTAQHKVRRLQLHSSPLVTAEGPGAAVVAVPGPK
jgi:hypothetical protein